MVVEVPKVLDALLVEALRLVNDYQHVRAPR